MKAKGYLGGVIPLTFALVVACAMVGSRIAMAQPKMNIHQATLEEPKQISPEISTEELKNLLSASKTVVIDARPEMQYALAHITGAINIGDKEEEYIMKNHPDKGTLIVLYCNGPY